MPDQLSDPDRPNSSVFEMKEHGNKEALIDINTRIKNGETAGCREDEGVDEAFHLQISREALPSAGQHVQSQLHAPIHDLQDFSCTLLVEAHLR